ncbi:MAG: hypothetical protein JWP06_207 [Candidatus Saccharibacteria bacterium]|nr:hypothetical protein [Candidatus Saccharibacteria bacterium]
MLHIAESFLDLKAMIIDLNDLIPARGDIIGEDIPRLFAPFHLGRTDHAELQAE